MAREIKIKEGDWVICIPGYTDNEGGSGYWPGRIFKVLEVTNGSVVWPDTFAEVFIEGEKVEMTRDQERNKGNGVFLPFLDLYPIELTHLEEVIQVINKELNG